MKVKIKLFLSTIVMLTVTLIFFCIISSISRPKVEFIEDNNKLTNKIESSIGHIYYDGTSKDVEARSIFCMDTSLYFISDSILPFG